MKLSDILLLTLFFVMGSMIFAIKQMQEAIAPAEKTMPVPAIKPQAKPLPKASPKPTSPVPALRLEMSTPDKAGSYDRLSLEEFLAENPQSLSTRETAPQNAVEQIPDAESVLQRPRKTPRKDQGDQANLETMPPTIQLSNFQYEIAEPVSLKALPQIDESLFLDRVVNMAEASPLQPDSRGCGTLNHTLKSAPKYAKIRSVGMERKLTERTSIGVEYVYKDGCYKNAIAPLKSLDMPGDDGVNLRVNMRF